ncbi:MAG: InlB B-repeat-containing protein [Lachnospiraceae bacterium]|nr:InlB B-repeat-containing protein [Lachnospiraceae bacterium]
MTSLKKKILALFLIFLMVMGSFPSQIFAEETNSKRDISFTSEGSLFNTLGADLPQDDEDLYISGAEITDGIATVAYCAPGSAFIEVSLLDENAEEEIVLASGSLTVDESEEEREVEITVLPEGGEEFPEYFLMKVSIELLEEEGEPVVFYNTDYTKKSEGTSLLGAEYFDYLPANHTWTVGDGYIVYASTAVVISEEESEILECTEDGKTIRISPVPTEIRNMTDKERSDITAIVFAEGDVENHRIIRTAPGTMEVFEEDGYLLVEKAPDIVQSGPEAGGSGESAVLAGVYESISLTASMNGETQEILVDEEQGAGILNVTLSGKAQYNWNFYLFYWDEELDYTLNCQTDYNLSMHQTTDYDPFGIDDKKIYEEFIQDCLYVEIPEDLIVEMDISSYKIPVRSIKIPNSFVFKAASNNDDIDLTGSLKSSFRLKVQSNMLGLNSSKAELQTTSEYSDITTKEDETFCWVCNSFSSDYHPTDRDEFFLANGESGDIFEIIRNDTEFETAIDKNGEFVPNGKIHYCGNVAPPYNYCMTIAQKPYYAYKYDTYVGAFLEGSGRKDNLFDAKTKYRYVSKPYEEAKEGTGDLGEDQCEHYGYLVHVTVYDKNGKLATGAEVSARGKELRGPEARFITGITDENGEADIYVPSGIWTVIAAYDGDARIGSVQADASGHPTSVVINGDCTYIDEVNIKMDIPAKTGEDLEYGFGAFLPVSIDPKDIPLYADSSYWVDKNGSKVEKTVDGAQFVEVTLTPAAHSTQGRVAFSKDLRVGVMDYNSVYHLSCQVVYVQVSEDQQSARVMIRLDTFPDWTDCYQVVVQGGFGSGFYHQGDTVFIAAYDFSEYEELHLDEFVKKLVQESVPYGWTGEFVKWEVQKGDPVYPTDFSPVEDGKYSLCSFVMPSQQSDYVRIEAKYKTEVDQFEVKLPIPYDEGIELPRRDSISIDTPLEANVLCYDDEWRDSQGELVFDSVYGDQYLALKVEALDEQDGKLKFADNLNISITDTSSGNNKKYKLVGYTVSEDKLSVNLLILVHVTRPGAKEYELTVNYGFMSGWYEAGTLVPIVSYDIPYLKDKLEEYLGKWAIVIKEILPPSWQKSFSSWRVDIPKNGSVRYKEDFIPIITTDGTTYAVAFFRMPSCDAEITAEYEGLKEIKEVVMDFDLPEPGEYLDYIAESESNGIKSTVPFADKLKMYPMMWSTIFPAEYNESYTAFIPISPKSGYKFGWPLGLTTKAYVPAASESGYTEADFFFAVGDYALITKTYKTPKAQLLQAIDPDPVYFENGTSSGEINEYLNSLGTTIVTEKGQSSAKVKWNLVSDTSAGETGRFVYDSNLETRQEVLDKEDGTYYLKGTVILPSNIRNEEAGSHSVVDQTVEVKIIIKAKEENEIYPPTALPPSTVSSSPIEVELKNDSKNPEGTEIWYKDASGASVKYHTPLLLEKRDQDTTYVIETWAKYGELTSPTVRYVYTVEADGKYSLKVYGGSIDSEANCSEAILDAGTEVTIIPNMGNQYEQFDHWVFNGLEETPKEAVYTFTMPAKNLEAVAVYVPRSDELLIDTVNLNMELPREGVKLAEQVFESGFTANTFVEDKEQYETTADPQPKIQWDVEGYPEAVAGQSYTAAIKLSIEDLVLDGKNPDDVYFSASLLGTVDGMGATVLVDSSRKYATIFVTFETLRSQYTVEYDANGGNNAPEAQIKEPEKTLVLTKAEPNRDGCIFKGWSSQKDGGVEYAPGDKYEKDEDAILYAVWEEKVTVKSVQIAFDVPAEEWDPLPSKGEIQVSVLDPEGAPISLKSAQWEDDLGLTTYIAETGDQYLILKIREENPLYSLDEALSAVVKDTSFGGNDKVKVQDIEVSEDGTEADIRILVHISEPGVKEYYVTVDDGIGDGYYEEGETVFIISYDIKSISTVLKEMFPAYKTIISLAEHFAEKLVGSFEKWEVIEPTDGTLVYKTDFWPVVLKSGKSPKVTYAAAFFTMPAHDVEVKAIYSSPKVIDSVTMNLDVPKIGQKLAELATCVNPEKGVKPVPLMGKNGKFKITWSGPDTVKYNEEYTARVYVTAESGYKLKEILDIVTIDSYFTKGYDFDNDVQPEGYAEGSTLGFMDYAILSYTYKTPKAQLLSIEQPNTIYFTNGTKPEEINEYLENLDIVITSEEGQGKAKAKWGEVIDTSAGQEGRFTYDSSLKTRQEVLDTESGVYKVQGTVKLPGSIRNTETKKHEVVDQTVEITVVILEKDSTELLPPTANPDSCESESELAVELINNEHNPEGTTLRYTLAENGTEGEETEYAENIILPQKDEDTQYVIKAWAENGEDVSETASFTYLIRAKENNYSVKVIGGIIKTGDEDLTEAVFEAGEEVVIKATPNEKYEKFDHWEFEGLEGTSEEEEYSFVMPKKDVVATAIFVPLSDDDVLVESAELILEEPRAGKKLAESVSESSYKDDKNNDLAAQPEPSVTWSPSDEEQAQEGKKYTASIVVDVNDLRLDGEKLPDSARLSGSFRATVNGKEPRVFVDESRKYAIVEYDFEIPRTTFTVTYDANGGDEDSTPAAQTKQLGVALTLTDAIPVKENYRFMGWSSQTDGGVEYKPGDLYEQDEDITLYAQWQREYTVKASASVGGTAYPSEQKVLEGQNAKIIFMPLVQETTAWMLDKVVLYDTNPEEGTDITDQVAGSVLKLENVQKDMNVYAYFKAAPYSVRAEVKEGKGSVNPEATGVEAGGTVDITITPDEGYELNKVLTWIWVSGKRSETDVTSTVKDGALTIEDINQNTYAEIFFKELEYTVTYDANGGSGAPESQTKKYHSDLTLSELIPEREGYQFMGWSTDPNATEAEYEPGSLFQINEDTTLYAVWTELFTVTAECSEGGSVDPAEQAVLDGGSASISIIPVEEENVVWRLSKVTMFCDEEEEGTDVTDQVSDGVLTLSNIDSDVRIYAEFKADPHTVTASVKDGKGRVTPESITVEHGDSVVVKISPEDKWSISKVSVWFGKEKKAQDLTGQVKNGELRLDKVSADIRIEVEFEYQASPDTSDHNQPYMWLIIFVASLIIAMLAVLRFRRIRK